MNANLRNVKAIIMVGILIVSLFTVFMPAISAGPIKNLLTKAYICYSNIIIDYDVKAASDPFLPVDMTKDIPINVSYSVTGYFAEKMMPYYKGVDSFIYLYVDETPDWCSAIISPSMLNIEATTTGVSKEAIVSVKVNENAHAFLEGKIRVRAEAKKLGAVNGGNFYQDIRFTPGYLPLLKIAATKSTYELIGPYDTANFGIKIENMGNAKTKVTCNLIDVPEGWSAHIDTTAVIGSRTSEDDTNKTVQLVVKPPYGFGYHDEREEIKVSITPSYFENESLKGNEYNLSFIVQSRGFFMPGFEAVFVIFALITIALIIKKQQRKKTFNMRDGEDEK